MIPRRSVTAFVLNWVLAWCWIATPAASLAEDHPLTEDERRTFQAELDPLQAQLAALRGKKDLNQDHLADAEVFIKGVVWGLDFGPIVTDQHRDMVRFGIRRAKERVDALSAGRHPWAGRRGKAVRGYYSAVDRSVQPYMLIVPEGYDPAKPIRLDVVLHGSMSAAGIAELNFLWVADGGDEVTTQTSTNDFIELHPLGRVGENAYRFEGETDIDEAIEAVCRDFNVDRRRVVLRGGSLGGVGTWQLGLKRPDRYVALGPVAGPVDTIEFANSPWPHFERLDPLTPWQEMTLHLVDAIDYTANAGMVGVVAVMGDQDPYYGSHLLMKQAFQREGIPFVDIVDVGAGHGVTAKAIQQQLELIQPLAAKGRDPYPKHVRFVTWTLKFDRCEWLQVLGLERHYQRAEIEATLGEDGSLVVNEPRNITRFAIYPPALAEPEAKLTVGGQAVELPPRTAKKPQPILIARQGNGWTCSGFLNEHTLSGKRPGIQGPIDDAFARPFLCVRGTGQPRHKRVGDWADASLKRFADEWRRHYRGYLPIKNDVDVTAEDVAHANLILFGDPGSNSWIEKVLPHLPIQWTKDELVLGEHRHAAADHAVQLIYPNPLPGGEGRYVVLNSGHTYHDKELRFSYMVFPRLGDWAVVKVLEPTAEGPVGSVPETVLDSGFFDESWGLPAGK